MTMTWQPRDSRGHYLASRDVHTTLGPEDWDDTCRHPQPAMPELIPSEDDFGHRPTKGISLFGLSEVVCQRCTEHGVWYGTAEELRDVHILWPCTSAIVLGLVPRPLP